MTTDNGEEQEEEEAELPYYGAPEGVIYKRDSDWLPEELKAAIDDWAPEELDLIEDENKIANVERLKEAFQSLFWPSQHYCNIYQLTQAARRLADLWHFRLSRNGFSLSMDLDFAEPPVQDTWSINFNQVTGKNANEWLQEVDPEQLQEPSAKQTRIPIKVTALHVYDPKPRIKLEETKETVREEQATAEEKKTGNEQTDMEADSKRHEKESIDSPVASSPSKRKHPSAAINAEKCPYHDMLFSRKFSDIRFLCPDGSKIPAHRMILAQASHKFEKRLQSIKESQWQVPYSSSVMKTILRHIYRNSVTEKDLALNEDPLSFLSFACKYGLDDLKRLAGKATICGLCSTNIANTLKMTSMYDLGEVKQACFAYAQKYPVDVLCNPGVARLGSEMENLWNELVMAIHGRYSVREVIRTPPTGPPRKKQPRTA